MSCSGPKFCGYRVRVQQDGRFSYVFTAVEVESDDRANFSSPDEPSDFGVVKWAGTSKSIVISASYNAAMKHQNK
uniref:Uncharacterized protein n=1 Tax=Romanomermis culicivorax TaxID=13658 RepID=A0A915HIB5_ROMCU